MNISIAQPDIAFARIRIQKILFLGKNKRERYSLKFPDPDLATFLVYPGEVHAACRQALLEKKKKHNTIRLDICLVRFDFSERS